MKAYGCQNLLETDYVVCTTCLTETNAIFKTFQRGSIRQSRKKICITQQIYFKKSEIMQTGYICH